MINRYTYYQKRRIIFLIGGGIIKKYILIVIVIAFILVSGCTFYGESIDTRTIPNVTITETLARINQSDSWIISDESHTTFYYFVISESGSYIQKSVPSSQSEVIVNSNIGTVTSITPEFIQRCLLANRQPHLSTTCNWEGTVPTHYIFRIP